jgi:hypothetical protein
MLYNETGAVDLGPDVFSGGLVGSNSIRILVIAWLSAQIPTMYFWRINLILYLFPTAILLQRSNPALSKCDHDQEDKQGCPRFRARWQGLADNPGRLSRLQGSKACKNL